MLHIVGMVMGTSTVAWMPLPFPYGSDGDPHSVRSGVSSFSSSTLTFSQTRVGSGRLRLLHAVLPWNFAGPGLLSI